MLKIRLRVNALNLYPSYCIYFVNLFSELVVFSYNLLFYSLFRVLQTCSLTLVFSSVFFHNCFRTYKDITFSPASIRQIQTYFDENLLNTILIFLDRCLSAILSISYTDFVSAVASVVAAVASKVMRIIP